MKKILEVQPDDNDTVKQKIIEVKTGLTKSIKLRETEFLSFKHINALQDIIKERKLDYLEIQDSTSEYMIRRLANIIKKYESKAKVRIQCAQFEASPLLDLEELLKDCQNIECTVNIFNARLKKIDVKIINFMGSRPSHYEDLSMFKNKEILTFVPTSSDDETSAASISEDQKDLWQPEDEIPKSLFLQDEVKAAGLIHEVSSNIDPEL